jgi:hypothetical protein
MSVKLWRQVDKAMQSTGKQHSTADELILLIYYFCQHIVSPDFWYTPAADAGKRDSTRDAELATECGTRCANTLQCDCTRPLNVHKALSISMHMHYIKCTIHWLSVL